MMNFRRISSQHYYDLLPQPEHKCGDIWDGLNTFGLLGQTRVVGIIVTPACDLENKKTETVTFLPIIPLRTYFSTLAALPEVKRAINSGLKTGKFDPQIPWGEFAFRSPNQSAIDTAIRCINEHLSSKERGAKEIAGLRRAQAGLQIAHAIAAPNLTQIPTQQLATAFSDWDSIKTRLIQNAYSNDLHFLPADEQDLLFSGLMFHSLVMFRYPVTVPIEVLDLARNANENSWPQVIDANVESIPYVENYRGALPIKTIRLKSEFLSDLLSRYVMIYNRIGSPDFTRASIGRICSEVDR